MIDTLRRSAFWAEFTTNRRLQWMTVGIVGILVLSFAKSLLDKLEENEKEARQTHQMIEKMVLAASNPVSDEMLTTITEQLAKFNAVIPVVESASIAEAEAFSSAKKIINTTIARPRSKLVGTETLTLGDSVYWQLRIQIDGGLHELNLIPLLKFFEKEDLQIRLNSLDFQPDSRGKVTLVIDYLYEQGNA